MENLTIDELVEIRNKIDSMIEIKGGGDNERPLGAMKLCRNKALSERFIASQSVPFVEVVGVYFLIKDGKIVYIGQSTNIFKRLYEHKKDMQKQWDSYAYIECSAGELDIVESLYMFKYEPIYNSFSHEPNYLYDSVDKPKYKRSTPIYLDRILKEFTHVDKLTVTSQTIQ